MKISTLSVYAAALFASLVMASPIAQPYATSTSSATVTLVSPICLIVCTDDKPCSICVSCSSRFVEDEGLMQFLFSERHASTLPVLEVLFQVMVELVEGGLV